MTSSFGIATELVDSILRAIAAGKQSFVIWGINENALDILATMHTGGLLSHVVALVDADTKHQGQSYCGKDVLAPSHLKTLAFDSIVISSNANKETALKAVAELQVGMPYIVTAGSAHYEFNDPVFTRIVASCPVKSKAGGYPHMLIHLYQALKYIAQRHLVGAIAEFGVFQGGTTVFMAKVLQHFQHDARIYGFDTFAGFPARGSVLDIYRDSKCEFMDYEAVAAYCSPYDIELVRGDIRDTYTNLYEVPLAMSFFDTDNYSATRQALPLCLEQTVSGGLLAFDHYYSPNWVLTIGERIAIREVLDDAPVFNLHGTGIFIKL